MNKLPPTAAALLDIFAEGETLAHLHCQDTFHILSAALCDDVAPDNDRLGIKQQKSAPRAKLQQFLDGKPCQHMLSWEASGTDKSSPICVARLHYRRRGLKSLQADLPFLPVYIDISFSSGDGGYRAPKVVLDHAPGGIAPNLLPRLASSCHLLARCRYDQRTLHLQQEDEEKQISPRLAKRFGDRFCNTFPTQGSRSIRAASQCKCSLL